MSIKTSFKTKAWRMILLLIAINFLGMAVAGYKKLQVMGVL